jgi:hypothetical protein
MIKLAAIFFVASMAFANELPLSVTGNGAAKSSGNSVQLSATAGQPLIGISASTNRIHGAGFWYGTGYAITGVDQNNSPELPLSFALHPVYPNPFNPTTHISFSVAHATHVKLNIFDIRGRLTETLTDKTYAAGNHNIVWNAHTLSSGTYFIRMSASEFESIQKAVLLK